MEGFGNAVKAICITSAAVCLLEHLVDGTRLRYQMKLLLNLIMAVVVIMPFVKGGASFELPEISTRQPVSDTALELYNRRLCREMADNIGGVLYSQIAAQGILCEKIDIEINISEDGSIFISKVTVSAEDFGAVAEVIRNSLGKETEVVNGNI
jgi:hypothetical protein